MTRVAVQTHQGVIAYEDLPSALHRYWEDTAFLPDLSQLLRSKPGDAIIVVPPTPGALALPDLGKFVWHDRP